MSSVDRSGSAAAAAPGSRNLAGAAILPRYCAGIALIALATLLLEVALTRVLSFTIWYHFAYVVLSTALLGYGAAGTLLSIRPAIGRANLDRVLGLYSIAAALAAALTLLFLAALPLDPMLVRKSPAELGKLALYQIVTAVPFFASGVAISLLLREGAARVDRLYFWDLIGAGLGCGLAVPLMDLVSPPGAVVIAAAAFALAAVVLSRQADTRLAAVAVGAVALCLAPVAARIPLTPASSKDLSVIRAHFPSEDRYMRWSSLFRTDVIEFTRSFASGSACPDWGVNPATTGPCETPRFHITHDATAGTGVYDLRDSHEVAHLDSHVVRLPYLVANRSPHVLVIGVGGGVDIIAAKQFGASEVTGVELDPLTIDVIHDVLNDSVAGFFRDPSIRLVAGEGRHFVESTGDRFDLIQLTGVDTLAAEFSGAYVLAENYLYTAEGMESYLERLSPGGILSFATGDFTPLEPRAAGRMVSTAREALLARGVTRPMEHIAVIDSGRIYVAILVSERPFDDRQLEVLDSESRRRGFTPLLLGRRGGAEIYESLSTLDGAAREDFLAKQRFLIAAISDDHPFFFMFHRWSRLLDERLQPTHVSALGQFVLLALLVTLTLLGGLFVVAPLAVFKRRGITKSGKHALGIIAYFSALGFGFMLFEISLIQKFVLFLGYPTYSLSVTLCGLLLSLGLGSYLSGRYPITSRTVLPAGFVVLALLVAAYALVLPDIQTALLARPLGQRIAATIILLLPLGLVLGAFFPFGVRRIASVSPDLVPWAWAINGCASVTGAVLAVVLAMSTGITAVWVLSVGVYAIGITTFVLTFPVPTPARE